MKAGAGALKGLVVLLALCAGAMLLSSVLAPLLQWTLRAAGVADPPFNEVVFRTLQLGIMGLTAVVLALQGAPQRASWGLDFAPGARRRAGGAFAVGLLALAVVCLVLWLLDVRTTRYDLITAPEHWIRVVTSALLSALTIAVVEELWFRGGLFSMLQRCGGVGVAVWFSSLLYALTHFVEPDAVSGTSAEDWRVVSAMLLASGRELFLAENLGSLLALTAAGVWLAIQRVRHLDILSAVFLHMGFVVAIKVFKKLTYIEQEAPLRWVAGDYDAVVSWLAFAILVPFTIVAWRRCATARGVPA